MGKSISFDIAALVLLIILLNSNYIRKMTSGISNRIFLIVTLVSIVATIFDIVAVTLDNVHSDNLIALYMAHSGYLMAHFLNAPLHLLFVISLTDTWHKLRKHIAVQALLVKRAFYNDKHGKMIMLNIGNFQAIQAMVGFDTAMQILKVDVRLSGLS